VGYAPTAPPSSPQVYWAVDDTLAQWQLLSDFFIAVAYFSIPVELIYFVHKSQVFPFKWILLQFGAFIILCGLTHSECFLFAVGPYPFPIKHPEAGACFAMVSQLHIAERPFETCKI
jgi:hypothetical protein